MTQPRSNKHTGLAVAHQPVSIAMASRAYWRFLGRVALHRHAHRREMLQLLSTGSGQTIRALAMRQGY